MNIEELRSYCLSKSAVKESFPFDEQTLVFKVAGKIFLLTNLDGEFSINVKCDPEKAQELREQYPQIIPGYHMNKKHWNTIMIDHILSDKMIKEWIDHSYQQVVNSLTKKQQKEIEDETNRV